MEPNVRGHLPEISLCRSRHSLLLGAIGVNTLGRVYSRFKERTYSGVPRSVGGISEEPQHKPDLAQNYAARRERQGGERRHGNSDLSLHGPSQAGGDMERLSGVGR